MATYYVREDGNNANTGLTNTAGGAWASLSYAASQVSTGVHIIYIESGSYTDNNRVNLAVGVDILGNSTTRPEITTSYTASGDDGYIRAYSSSNVDGDNTISYININGNSLTSNRAIYAENRNNVIVHHCDISDFLVGGIYFESEDAWNAEPSSYIYDCMVYNCNITNCSNRSYEHEGLLRATSCHDLLVYNNVFKNDERSAGSNGNILTLTFQRGSKFHDNTYYRLDNEGGNWAFYVELFHPRGGMEVYNEIFIGGGTWDMGASPMTDGCYITPGYGYTYALSIHDNDFNTTTDAQLSTRNGGDDGKTHIAIDIEGPLEDVLIYNNHIDHYGNGISMVTGTVDRTYAQDRVYIYSNIIEHVGYTAYTYSYGIFLNDEANYPNINTKDNIHVWNNTITGGSGYNYQGIVCHWRGNLTNISIKNNIFYDFDQQGVAISRQTDGSQELNITNIYVIYNNFYSCGSTITRTNITSETTYDYTTGNQSIAIDPGLESDWHISSTSSAVYHVGTNVGLTYDYDGVAWNTIPSIGAFEYVYAGTVYYVKNGGNDSYTGLSDAQAWATITKVNAQTFSTGTSILFNRGDTWREEVSLVPDSGSTGTYVTYGAYGTGDKPKLLGSTTENEDSDWTVYSENIWQNTDSSFSVNVGNIIFNNEASYGVYKVTLGDVASQGDYFFNVSTNTLYLYSVSNPGTYYSNIECALDRHIIAFGTSKSYVVLENLDLRYGAGHGVSGYSGCSYITIQDCDFSYIGGGYFEDGTARYGNGIEFWQSSDNITIQRCKFDHIYDAAITPQFSGVGTANITNWQVRYNLINNSEYSFEGFIGSESSGSWSNIYIQNNTMRNAGGGFGHNQRPDSQNGRHIMIWIINATTSNFYIRNNIFDTATESALWLPSDKISSIVLDYNSYNADIVGYNGSTNYTTLVSWQSYSSDDSNSISGDPILVSISDFHLTSISPCIGQGVNVGYSADFDLVSWNDPPSIGAYEYTGEEPSAEILFDVKGIIKFSIL